MEAWQASIGEAQLKVHFSERHILKEHRPTLWVAGDFQYFRIPLALWRPSLEQLRAAGLGMISIYVPWIWHEVTEGQFDFKGETDPARNLLAFLALCETLELPVVLKPGPYIFAEYQGFGVPDWVRLEHPELLMNVIKPQEQPQPTLNHPEFLGLVNRWFCQVAEQVRPFVARGTVVAIQIDNETGYPQFGQGPHMSDRNPAALAHLRQSLPQRFSSIIELNQVWGTQFASFEEVDPPDERLFNAAQLDTMARYVEDYIVDFLRALKAMWLALDLDVYYYLNDIWLDAWPSHIGKKNTVAPLAYDLYPRYSELPVVFDQPYSISFVPKLYGAFLRGGPLISSELGSGWLDPACEVSLEATWQSSMASFAHGVQACFYYTVMDGQDPDGAYVFKGFLNAEGAPLARMDVLCDVSRFCLEWGSVVAATHAINSKIAILHYPAITREMMAAALAPLEVLVRGSQKAIDEALTIVSVNAGLYGALSSAGYTPNVLNLDWATPEELDAHSVIFFNAIGTVDQTSQKKLLAFVKRGGKLVTLGTPFAEESPLFPARVTSVNNPQAIQVLWAVAWEIVRLHWRISRQFAHKWCAYTVKGMFPVMLMVRHAARTGLWLNDKTSAGRLWASRLVTLSKVQAHAKPLLSYGGRSAGYQVAVEAGLSVFIGTLLGASFDSPGFYLDDPERKRSVSRFLSRLLTGFKLHPITTPVEDVETVVREGNGYRVIFLINRGPATHFQMVVRLPWETFEKVGEFARGNSNAHQQGNRLMGALDAHDVLVLFWKQTP